jgi:hypothetical protein
VVRDIASILNLKGTAKEIEDFLEAYLVDTFDKAPRRGPGKLMGDFMDHVSDVSERWWARLFHCYDVADLPRNNNAMEQFFNAIKHHARRIHGRKSTSGGPLDSFAPYLLEIWTRTEERPSLQKQLEGLPAETIREAREELAKHAEPSRRRRARIRRPSATH